MAMKSLRSLKSMLPAIQRGFGMKDTDRVAARAAEVRAMFKDAIFHSYHGAAPTVLAHVNAVYILTEKEQGENITKLVVYMDDANFRSDLLARQYFILLWLKERYGQVVDEFKAYSSRASMRRRHAYDVSDETSVDAALEDKGVTLRPLTDDDERELASWGLKIEDVSLRSAFLKAARSGVARWDL